ncbi:MAG TPA: DNA-directed RNA polymerase subunit omega [Bacillota bacterium]|nr:DNA-directed RNA polymerase subunit omega [Bacillota bacterium]
MILEPSIDSLQKHIKSKYTLVTLSAKRARQLSETKKPYVENPQSHKYIGVALEEVQAGKLYVHEKD